MKITIISVGKLKEKYIREAAAEYLKRLTRYCKPDIIELPDEKTPDNAGEALENLIRNREGDRIISRLPADSYIIPLAIDGKPLSSEEFADTIHNKMISGISNITFIIGGSLGLSDNVLKKGELLLSFSKMTFPHQLMRVILLEQIYRSFRIISGEPYHK